jgi:hypothetical protein
MRPGAEFPAAVYWSIAIAFAWMMAAAWLAFGGNGGTDLNLAVATALCIVFFAVPLIMYRTASARCKGGAPALRPFLSDRVEIATGALSGGEAWLQVILIPLALALAATVIGASYAFLR